MPDNGHLNRPLLTAAALAGALGVAAAARGQHASGADMTIAAAMLLAHAPVLLFVSLVPGRRMLQVAGYVMLAGLLWFAGNLALRAELGQPLFPMATPLGGLGLILGWLGLAVGAWTR
jgi:uncharacterized membrane protein YgdD (TMEM256/DUF423 family)